METTVVYLVYIGIMEKRMEKCHVVVSPNKGTPI